MPVETLSPQLELLQTEYVIVQAWKKAVAYIRAHNWYTDTLELDRATVDLREFVRDFTECVKRPATWRNTPLRIVPAPKSQNWRVEGERWMPAERIQVKQRPLAHVGLHDQIAATAVMLCLADRVETLQGNPTMSPDNRQRRRGIVSYGNRLFCDSDGSVLRHRWGSVKLYRSYFSDCQMFVARPEMVAREQLGNGRAIVVHSDLKQFYDRVTPSLIGGKLRSLMVPGDDPAFYEFAERLLQWQWYPDDRRTAHRICKAAGLDPLDAVTLPQGARRQRISGERRFAAV